MTAFTDDDRIALLKTMADEQKAKVEGRPYSEAVIVACETALRVNASLQPVRAHEMPYEAPKPRGNPQNLKREGAKPRRVINPEPNFWWLRD